MDFGRNNQALARDIVLLDGGGDDAFRVTVTIDVGGVPEVDPVVPGVADEGEGFFGFEDPVGPLFVAVWVNESNEVSGPLSTNRQVVGR